MIIAIRIVFMLICIFFSLAAVGAASDSNKRLGLMGTFVFALLLLGSFKIF